MFFDDVDTDKDGEIKYEEMRSVSILSARIHGFCAGSLTDCNVL